ncbi:hypothetical protein [Nitrospira sp. Nam80]
MLTRTRGVEAALRAAHAGEEKPLATAPWRLWVAVGGFAMAYVLMFYADRRMSSVLSQFWHRTHLHLRDALKQARMTALEYRRGRDEGGVTDG